MLSDPRIGLIASLGIATLAGLWLLAQWLASNAIWDALWPVLGYGVHAVTLLAIFLLIAGAAVALLFRRYARVKADLLAGRNVIARWVVDPVVFQSFSVVAEKRDRAEKRGALYLVFFFVAIAFGFFALIDPEVAPAMISAGGAVALMMAAAFWLSNRVRKRHLQIRSGEIIVGTEGVLVNGVLHVWSAFLSWLVGVELENGPPATLTITYAFLARYGAQFVSVMVPVPDEAMDLAIEVKRQLEPTTRKRSPRRVGRRHKARGRPKAPGASNGNV